MQDGQQQQLAAGRQGSLRNTDMHACVHIVQGPPHVI